MKVVFCWRAYVKFLPNFSTFCPPMLITFRHMRWSKNFLQCDSDFHETRFRTEPIFTKIFQYWADFHESPSILSRFSWKSTKYEPSLEAINEFLRQLPTFISDLRKMMEIGSGKTANHGNRCYCVTDFTTYNVVTTVRCVSFHRFHLRPLEHPSSLKRM